MQKKKSVLCPSYLKRCRRFNVCKSSGMRASWKRVRTNPISTKCLMATRPTHLFGFGFAFNFSFAIRSRLAFFSLSFMIIS